MNFTVNVNKDRQMKEKIYVNQYLMSHGLDSGLFDSFNTWQHLKNQGYCNYEYTVYLKDSNNGIEAVRFCDIIYLEIIGRKIKVITKDNVYFSSRTMSDWYDVLQNFHFALTHKSFIINLDYITYYKPDHVILDERYYIPISYKKRSSFRKAFLDICALK